jgi:hypothetical protein
MKLILLALAFYTVFEGVIVADALPDENLKQLQHQLNAGSPPKTDEEYHTAEEAYAHLMHLGSHGFDVVAEAWAYGQISEEDWLEWQGDFLQKFVDSPGANNATDDAYANYLDRKLAKDDKFAAASAQRLTKVKVYGDEVLISMWLQGGVGFRRVGYMALKQRHPDLPVFDYQAGDEKRKQQLQEIEAFLKSKKTTP